MQNTVRWRSDQFQPTHIWNPWQKETDANLEDSACKVRVLLSFRIVLLLALRSALNQSVFVKRMD